MAPHVPFRGVRAVDAGTWTYFDSYWLYAFHKLSLYDEKGHIDGQLYRPKAAGVVSQSDDEDAVQVLEGVSERSRIVIDLQARFIKMWIGTLWGRTKMPKLSKAQHSLTIAFSYHQGSTFRKAALSTLPATKPAELPSDECFQAVWQWELNHLDSDMQRFIDAAMQDEKMQVLVAVTADTKEPKPRPLVNGWPDISNLDKTLESMALLIASPASTVVKLLASDSDGQTESVKVHRKLLEEASPYFHTLLSGGFAETSALAQSSPSGTSGTTTATSTSSASPVRRARKRQKKSSPKDLMIERCTANSDRVADISVSAISSEASQDLNSQVQVECQTAEDGDGLIPVIHLSDTSFDELRTLVYYVYTGLAVFKQRTQTSRIIEELPKSSPSWKRGVFPVVEAVSMYRVADRYDFEGLRSSALAHIASEISLSSLADDLRTIDALHIFPPLKRLYLDFCMRHQSDLIATSNYDDIMNFFVSGPPG